MRSSPAPIVLGLLLATASATGTAAQVASRFPTRPGPYGGGFIELLMGGSAASTQPSAERGRRTYAALPQMSDGPFVERGLDPAFRRQVVAYPGVEAPGTVVIDTGSRFLYHVRPGGSAVRYGIGVGRPGFTWAGVKTVTMKREWPDWTPPPQMLARRPDLPRHMAGGLDNPLGARALYLGSSLYRIHGTNEPGTIGQNVSSGCIRMMNEDVVDLYNNVPVGARVVVM